MLPEFSELVRLAGVWTTSDVVGEVSVWDTGLCDVSVPDSRDSDVLSFSLVVPLWVVCGKIGRLDSRLEAIAAVVDASGSLVDERLENSLKDCEADSGWVERVLLCTADGAVEDCLVIKSE
jgi:hypothetical protein